MSDQPPGPGWWLASDGHWYPPELHPGASPQGPWSTIPPSPAKRSPMPWIVIGTVAAVVLVAIAAVVFLGTSGGRQRGSAIKSQVAPATGPVVSASGGTVSLTLPAGWRGADLSAGIQGAASDLFPDDPNAAATIEQRLTVLPRAIVLFGVRPTPGATFTDNVNVLPDPTAPPNLSLEQIGPAEARGIGQFATITGQTIVDLGGRQAYRIVYKTATVSGVAYIIKGTSDTWVVTYTFGAPSADIDLAESSAITFSAP